MPAKKYNEKPVDKWNVKDFLDYLTDKHLAVYGTEYVPPARNWQAERGLIGGLIGTRGKNAKPRKYEPEVVKAFIDHCFANHSCTPQWPTVNFSWWWKWKAQDWARIVAQEQRRQAAETAQETQANEDLRGWF